MSKISSIQAQLNKAAGKAPIHEAPATSPNAESAANMKKSSRAGKVHIGAYLPEGFKSSLRLVQAQTGEDTQEIIARALNDVFRARNVPVVGE